MESEHIGIGSRLALPTDINDLPEDLVAQVISLTTPCDAARVASVSKLFKSAADSNSVWETFLPSDYHTLVASSSFLDLPKKDLYRSLCDYPIEMDDEMKIMTLDKRSGKKCYMISPEDLYITGDLSFEWDWISLPESRFPEVAELIWSWDLEIEGSIGTEWLSEETLYTVSFVYKLRLDADGFLGRPFRVEIETSESKRQRTVMLEYGVRGLQTPRPNYRSCRLTNDFSSSTGLRENDPHLRLRGDGWMEVEVGEFYNKGDKEEEITMKLWETKLKGDIFYPYKPKSGLIVHGFEIRPKTCL